MTLNDINVDISNVQYKLRSCHESKRLESKTYLSKASGKLVAPMMITPSFGLNLQDNKMSVLRQHQRSRFLLVNIAMNSQPSPQVKQLNQFM